MLITYINQTSAYRTGGFKHDLYQIDINELRMNDKDFTELFCV